ncbi:chalcone isomerase family protein [Ferrimonas senticii]|uniref:chalcone isomerase family protein n=1 Tax=Ferrimonas senticii TaxID=394566 RepID=UPI000420D862|nr:chalcone isomerase family protein [Ferrimonas senticii]
MKKTLLALMLAATSATSMTATAASQAHTVADVTLANQIQVGEQSLSYYGAGVRSKFFMDLYVGALYAEQSGLSAEAVIAGNAVSAVRLNILSDMITSERMIDTIEEGFEQASDGNVAPLRQRLDAFVAVFDEAIAVGDQFTLVSLPGVGIDAYKNGQLLTKIEGDDFRQTLFSIWLGDDPADKKLKNKMLGK